MKDAEAGAIAHVDRPIDGRHEYLAREECCDGDKSQYECRCHIDGGCQRRAAEGARYDEEVEMREGAAQEEACRVGGQRAKQERCKAERVQDHPAEQEGRHEDSRL